MNVSHATSKSHRRSTFLAHRLVGRHIRCFPKIRYLITGVTGRLMFSITWTLCHSLARGDLRPPPDLRSLCFTQALGFLVWLVIDLA